MPSVKEKRKGEKGSFFGDPSKRELDDYRAASLSMNIVFGLFTELELNGISLPKIAKDLKCSVKELKDLRLGRKRVDLLFVAKMLNHYSNDYRIDYYFLLKVRKNG